MLRSFVKFQSTNLALSQVVLFKFAHKRVAVRLCVLVDLHVDLRLRRWWGLGRWMDKDVSGAHRCQRTLNYPNSCDALIIHSLRQ